MTIPDPICHEKCKVSWNTKNIISANLNKKVDRIG